MVPNRAAETQPVTLVWGWGGGFGRGAAASLGSDVAAGRRNALFLPGRLWGMGCGGPNASPWNLGNYGNELRKTTNTDGISGFTARGGRNGKVWESSAPFFFSSFFLSIPFCFPFPLFFNLGEEGRHKRAALSLLHRTLLEGPWAKSSTSLNFSPYSFIYS